MHHIPTDRHTYRNNRNRRATMCCRDEKWIKKQTHCNIHTIGFTLDKGNQSMAHATFPSNHTQLPTKDRPTSNYSVFYRLLLFLYVQNHCVCCCFISSIAYAHVITFFSFWKHIFYDFAFFSISFSKLIVFYSMRFFLFKPFFARYQCGTPEVK